MAELAEKFCIPVAVCNPSLSAEQLRIYVEHSDAVIVVAYATGTSPDWLEPAIREATERGVAVIMLSNNPADPHGPVRLKYKAGQANLNAGARLLQRVNVNHLEEVQLEIARALDRGLRGKSLSDYIEDKYRFKDGEKPVPPEWDTVEGIALLRERTIQALRRQGMNEPEIDETIRKWNSDNEQAE